LKVYDVRSGQEIAGFSQKSIENWSVLLEIRTEVQS
jgi:hypothetical protein